jgi:hypothetical protein
MDMIVLNLPKASEIIEANNDHQDKQKQLWEQYKAERRKAITEYVKEHLQDWLMDGIKQMQEKHLTYYDYVVCQIPCDVVFKSYQHTRYHYSEGNFLYSYADKARDILIEVMDEILDAFTTQQKGTPRYYAHLRNVSCWKRELVYGVTKGDKDYSFSGYNSCSLKDVYDGGHFYIHMAVGITDK